MDISSLCYSFDDVLTLLAIMKIKFKIIGITESRLKKHTARNINIDLNRYAIGYTSTEASCGVLSFLLTIPLIVLSEMTLQYTKRKNLSPFL